MSLKPALVYTIISLIFLSVIGLSQVHSSNLKETYSVYGKTMGTYYSVQVYTPKTINTANLKQKIDAQLRILNRQMSLYSKTSEISKFNRTAKDKPMAVSKDFFKVMKQAKKIYALTDGAWDGTIRPLYELWNFDRPVKMIASIPDENQINSCLKKTGFNNLIIADRELTKKIAGLNLDLGSIAKGYGVDAVTSMLKGSGYKNFFVEIGGEVYVAGKKGHKKKWRLGIASPENNNAKPFKIIRLTDKAIATSGTYQNFFKFDGKTYSHIINPKTGWPIANKIVSVSVIADNCMLADGLATGLMVMGRQNGVTLINSLNNIECMVVVKTEDEKLKPFFSKGFKKYLH